MRVLKLESLVFRVRRRCEHLVGVRVVDHAKYRATIERQRNRDGILWNALQELARAVQRVDDPDAAVEQALAVVVGFLGEPGVVGKCAEQSLAERVVDFDVGFGDDFVAEAAAGPGLAVAALLPAVASARLLVTLQDLAAAPGSLLGGLQLCSQVKCY